MRIGGLHKTSLIDYPGKLGAVIFTQGCNFRCPFCYNPDLVDPQRFRSPIPEEEILAFLARRVRILEGVTISGGEPLLQEDLPDFCGKVREMGFAVKIDTNGTVPEMLGRLISSGRVDYVAMDVKAPLDRYETVARAPADILAIRESIRLIIGSGVPYEFRTTVVRTLLSPEDLRSIGTLLKGARLCVLQKFRPAPTLDPDFSREKAGYSEEELGEICASLKECVLECRIR